MTLSEKQRAFSWLVAELIIRAHELGFEVVLGEAYRPPETAKLYASKGVGIENSLHSKCLAIDINLFKDGVYLMDTEDYKELGEWWKLQSQEGIECCWGGDFEMRDGCHFSVEHKGVK